MIRRLADPVGGVEYVSDPDVRSRGFAVPALHIVGSADPRDAAHEQSAGGDQLWHHLFVPDDGHLRRLSDSALR